MARQALPVNFLVDSTPLHDTVKKNWTMHNTTTISFELFKTGKPVRTLMIDPHKDKRHHFEPPEYKGKGKLFAHAIAMTSPENNAKQSLHDVTTETQFQSLIISILEGKYGTREKDGKPHIVMVTINQLEQ